jgi:hypothetical protein
MCFRSHLFVGDYLPTEKAYPLLLGQPALNSGKGSQLADCKKKLSG